MMNILEQIIADKRKEVSDRSKSISLSQLQNTPFYQRDCISLRESLSKKESTGVIAEFKRRSPSKGWIFPDADVVEVTASYLQNGAAALSILTDEQYFGGRSEDLIRARNANIPILRKDFIIDSYQIEEAKSIGADVILLIAACLTPEEVKHLAAYARRIGLEVLLELHQEEELAHICDETEIIGINNRDLKTFQVDIERSLKMASLVPDGKIKVAESGIDSPEMINVFRKAGFSGFLIGEFFMRTNNPGESLADLVRREVELRAL